MSYLHGCSQAEICFYCGIPSSAAGLDRHHVVSRGVAPGRVRDETNLMWLCRKDHDLATRDHKFAKLLETLWNKNSSQ